ncbi:MAG: hypothetical protein KGN16_13860 [Burkholderiales bacterium]|nr:hypothetical protein [Burkholderiales bacterium]
MNQIARMVAISSIALLGACASVQYGDKVSEAELKKFLPLPDAVSLYVCREQALLFAAGVRTIVMVDNQPIGTLKPNMFAHAIVKPGKHEVFLKRDGIYGGQSGVFTFDAKAGDLAFVWAGMTGMGFGTLTVDAFDNVSSAQDCVKGAAYAVVAE